MLGFRIMHTTLLLLMLASAAVQSDQPITPERRIPLFICTSMDCGNIL
jgi:hypothetical protein